MNFILFLLFCFLFSNQGNAQQKMFKIGTVDPIKYEMRDGKLQSLHYLKGLSLSEAWSVRLNNKELSFEKTEKTDSVMLWLPLIGDVQSLELKEGNKKPITQNYQPLIPADWGYFKGGVIHLIQSSHQDIAWMDTPEYCRTERINDIIMPALEMMKKNKSVTFEMEQTLNLMEFLEAHPGCKEDIQKLYNEKRFAWGATYNQPYEGLSSGEQLVRQAYYGRKWVKDNFPGADDLVANNMDVPGRTLQMPQILSKSGIPYLFISRMGEGLYDWYSPDGSKVLTFTPGNYGWASMIWKFFDKDAVTAFHKLHHRTLLWNDYYKKHQIPPHYAILISCDGTKPVDFQSLIDEWNHIVDLAEVQLPRLKSSTAEEYFKTVQSENSNFEKICGERPNLWLYIHGPAHYESTSYKRESAVSLPAAETFTTFSCLLQNNLNTYPHNLFDRAWKASIYPDHGLGGKNGEVTDQIFLDSLKVSRNIGKDMLNASLKLITNEANVEAGEYLIFNDRTWSRTDLVQIETNYDKVRVLDAQGKEVCSQLTKDSLGRNVIAFFAENVPSMGYKSYRIKKGKTMKGSSRQIGSNFYENTFYKVQLGNGGIVSLIDKKIGKDLIHSSKFACGDVIEVGYTGNGAGEFTRVHDVTPGDIVSLTAFDAQWSIIENGEVFTRYYSEQPTKFATIEQKITFYHNIKKIDFDITLRDFTGEHNRQYRIAFPLNMMDKRTINYEVPMAILEVGEDEMKQKPMGWSWGGSYVHYPVDTHPREIQNFMTVSGNFFGFTMSSPVAVADWIDPSREQAVYPVLQGILLSSHKSCHGAGNWYNQKGTHNYHFSVNSHVEGWKNGYHFGMGVNNPLRVMKKENEGGNLDGSHSFLQISDPFVLMSLVKKADNDESIIIRLTEMEGKDKTIKLTLPIEVKQVIRTNLIEDEIEIIPGKGECIAIDLGHHAIETFKFKF